MNKETLSSTMKDLLHVCINKDISTWQEVKRYAEKHSKYDKLSLRDIDTVFKELIRQF